MFDAGPVYLRVRQPKHDWTKAREEWLRRRQEAAASSILQGLHAWRARMRPSVEGRDEDTGELQRKAP